MQLNALEPTVLALLVAGDDRGSLHSGLAHIVSGKEQGIAGVLQTTLSLQTQRIVNLIVVALREPRCIHI
jgi:hypothetical protein